MFLFMFQMPPQQTDGSDGFNLGKTGNWENEALQNNNL